MLLSVRDANGEEQNIVAQAVETLTDRSGVIGAGTYTVVMEANEDRAGWFFQNQGAASMTINEMGDDPTDGGIVVAAGASFPPPGYPLTTAEIRVKGTLAQVFAAREW